MLIQKCRWCKGWQLQIVFHIRQGSPVYLNFDIQHKFCKLVPRQESSSDDFVHCNFTTVISLSNWPPHHRAWLRLNFHVISFSSTNPRTRSSLRICFIHVPVLTNFHHFQCISRVVVHGGQGISSSTR